MISYRCKNCQWWDSIHPSVKLVPKAVGKEDLGYCRKHKPGALRVGEHFYGAQPIMDADEFCAEFRGEE